MKKSTKAILAGALALTMGATVGMMVGCDDKDKIVVGITDYAPMDYKENGEWKGFDYELANLVFSDLGYKEVTFLEMDWDTKIVTLNAKEIDVIWNGMTVTEELKKSIALSDTYLQNRQYGVVKTEMEGVYTDAASLANAIVAVEAGSAAEDLMVNEDETLNCKKLNKASNQNAAIMEVAAGTSDVAIVDYLLAKEITTSPTSSYREKLVAVDLGFEVENFAIGFRKKDTALRDKVNEKIKAFYADGTIAELAKKYGIEGQLIVSE